ncbi:MAG TPA: hypothetical protein VG347_05725 [Verrucomicrobiae bacterium]|nr:hypothetical protein [Verrucomicrobiae bacterium]
MIKSALFVLLQVFCLTASFGQNPPWKANGAAISVRPDLDVQWLSTNAFPREVWFYEIQPNAFSSDIISNVIEECSFTEKDKIKDDASGTTFRNAEGSRTLSISFSSGEINYETPRTHYGPTNLAIDVPQTNQLPALATNLLQKLHIRSSDISTYAGQSSIRYLEPALTMFYAGDNTITNIPYRSIYFRRFVDGMPIIGRSSVIDVGEHGKVEKIAITWPVLKRIKPWATVTQSDLVNYLRKGDAIRGPVPSDVGDIDWPSIKRLTIKMAIPSYQSDGKHLFPFLRLDAIVDTGSGSVPVGMDCPIIDEASTK